MKYIYFSSSCTIDYLSITTGDHVLISMDSDSEDDAYLAEVLQLFDSGMLN